MKTLIKNATVVLPEGSEQTSVLIDGSRIADVDPAIQLAVDETVDATALYRSLFPQHIHGNRHTRVRGSRVGNRGLD